MSVIRWNWFPVIDPSPIHQLYGEKTNTQTNLGRAGQGRAGLYLSIPDISLTSNFGTTFFFHPLSLLLYGSLTFFLHPIFHDYFYNLPISMNHRFILSNIIHGWGSQGWWSFYVKGEKDRKFTYFATQMSKRKSITQDYTSRVSWRWTCRIWIIKYLSLIQNHFLMRSAITP